MTNVTSSYSMEYADGVFHEGSPLRVRGKSFHEEVSPDSVTTLVDIDVKKKRPSLSHQTSIIAPTCLYRRVSGDEINADTEEDERKLGGVSLGFSLSIQKPSDQSGGNDVDTTEADSPIHKSTPMGRAASRDSIDAINVLIEDGGEDVVGSPIYTPKTKTGTEAAGDELIVSDPSTCNRACFYTKKSSSVICSILASLSFGILAYGLGGEIDQGTGIAMFADGLIANALLYYTIYDGVSAADFPVGWNQPRSKNAALLCFGVLNLIASIPLGYYIGYSSILGYTPDAFAQFTGAVSFISLLLLYSQAAKRFTNDISNKVNMMKLKGEQRVSAYSRQAYLDEVAALGRGEIDNLFNIIESKSDDFNGIMHKLKPKGANDRFWTKEIVGGVFGLILAGGFGGVYLFEIGFSVYELFLRYMFPKLSKHIITNLSYAGACAIAIGPNTLQIEKTYKVFKTNTIQILRWYDSCFKNNHLLLTSRVSDEEGGISVVPFIRNTSPKEMGVDALVLLLAGGVALTRTALCLKYIKDRPLVDPVTISTTMAMLCVYGSVIKTLADKSSETGRKRNVIDTYINAEFDKLDAEMREDNRL